MPHLRARIVLQDSEKGGHDIRDTQFALSASFAGQPVKRDDPDTRHWIAEGVAEHLGRSVVVVVVKGVQAVPSDPRVRVMASRDLDGLGAMATRDRARAGDTPHCQATHWAGEWMPATCQLPDSSTRASRLTNRPVVAFITPQVRAISAISSLDSGSR